MRLHSIFYCCDLKSKNADVNFKDDQGVTPLMACSLKAELDIIQTVLNKGGRPSECDHAGNTAIFYAVDSESQNKLCFIKVLLSRGCDINHLNCEKVN